MAMRFDDFTPDSDPQPADKAHLSEAARQACREGADAPLPFEPDLVDRKQFTLDEANRSLVYLEPIVTDVTRTYRRIIHLRRRLDHANDGATETRLEREYDRCMDRLGDFVDELHDVGVELRDFELGLIDFPARVNERQVYYTWQPGDAGVEHWHDYDDAGFGRRPIKLLKAG